MCTQPGTPLVHRPPITAHLVHQGVPGTLRSCVSQHQLHHGGGLGCKGRVLAHPGAWQCMPWAGYSKLECCCVSTPPPPPRGGGEYGCGQLLLGRCRMYSCMSNCCAF
jgi:hypothetical protein